MIVVKYFGNIAEKSNCNEELMALSDASLERLVNELKIKYHLNDFAFSVAVNQKIVLNWDNYDLQSNDVVAFLPPFAGG